MNRNEKNHSKTSKVNGEILELRRLKKAADSSFEKQDFISAMKGYQQILESLENIQVSVQMEGLESCLTVKLLANIAQCLLKLNRFEESLEYSLRVINMDHEYFKAHYRAGVALKCLKRDDEALEVLKQGLAAARACPDDHSRKTYLDLFHELEKACDKSIEAMKEQIQDFYKPNKNKPPSKFTKYRILDRTTVLLSLTTAAVTGTVCLWRRQLFNTYGILLATGSALGGMSMLRVRNPMLRVFGLCGLLFFNYLLFIMQR
jgi:tetratricopeptide (TPR) repeat protein